MTKIVCLSDTHGLHWDLDKIPEGDILIHCGDITGRGTMLEVINFNNWLSELPHPLKIVIAGNHDMYLAKGKTQSQVLLDQSIYLENNLFFTSQGLAIWGSPITPRFMNWYFMEDRDKIDNYWNMIPKEIDILVTHGPAYGILDKTVTGESVGCKSLLKKVQEIKPKYHIFGHIHGGYGIKKVGETTFVNCSSCSEDYKIVNKPIVIEI